MSALVLSSICLVQVCSWLERQHWSAEPDCRSLVVPWFREPMRKDQVCWFLTLKVFLQRHKHFTAKNTCFSGLSADFPETAVW